MAGMQGHCSKSVYGDGANLSRSELGLEFKEVILVYWLRGYPYPLLSQQP